MPGLRNISMKKEYWILLLAAAILAGVLPLIDRTNHWPQGWLAYFIVLAIGGLCILGVRKAVKATRKATITAWVAFCLRLGIGVALFLLLPVIGYTDNSEHQAGYVYTDANNRDVQAWSLARSGSPLTQAFSGQYTGDQYGGMLALSALIYRTLSYDAHRPILILILGATASSMGVLCLWKAAGTWFDEQTALLATWLFAVYPEAVLLGSSQMREAIVIPAIAISFYGLTEIQAKKGTGWLWMLLSGSFIFLIQPLAGFVSFTVLFGVWLFDPTTLSAPGRRRTIVIIFGLIAILLVIMLLVSSILANLPSVQGSRLAGAFITWFRNNFTYQSYLTERSSGIFQSLLDSLGEQWRWLVVLVYGIAQPVLPAIVGDPSAVWIMRLIGFLRAAGWYVLALFLVYGVLGSLRIHENQRRFQLIWISLVSWSWIMLAALNAGADQWDNPRYRALLLLWQVMLAAWALGWARSHKDAWLWRFLAIEAVFVLLFTEWYLGRYYPGFFHLNIMWMILITLSISAAIIIAGLIWDKKHSIR